MRTIRRLYFYAVALVSLEVVVWGVIGLARTLLAQNLVGGRTTPLAQGLALTLVGIPVFLIHWSVAQRDAGRDSEERESQIRGLFFYGALLGTLIPIAQSGLALLNRLVLIGFGLDPTQAIVGGNQIWSDNLVAILINAGAAAYLSHVLTRETLPGEARARFSGVHRLYRYVWLIYALILVVIGVQAVLSFLLFVPTGPGGGPGFRLANAIALLLIGLPLWVRWGLAIEGTLTDPEERESLLRLVVLYLLALAGVGVVLSTAGFVLAALLRILFGEATSLADFMREINGALSLAIPMAGVWAYYGRRLNLEVAALREIPRRAGLRRLYAYILAAFGLTATFLALQQLITFLIDNLIGGLIWGTLPLHRLANALASLAVGLPLWWLTWNPMQAEARAAGSAGDHARRSLVRKAYLYLALFAAVIGAMASGGRLVYQVLTHLLGSPAPYFAADSWNWLQTCLLFLLWLVYFWQALRGDNRLSERSLADQHAAFPTFLISSGDDGFSDEIAAAVHRHAPEIPLTVQSPDSLQTQPGPGEGTDPAKARAVILPASLAVHPTEDLRQWLLSFEGKRIIVPEPDGNDVWLGGSSLSRRDLARQAAVALRQLAEDQPVHVSPPANAWMITGYILGGLFGFELLALLVALTANALSNR